MKRYLVHPIGDEPKVIRADRIETGGHPPELHFLRGSEAVEIFYLHALRRPVQELPDRDGELEVLESPIRGDW
jgi:hypothetical protein